MLALKVLFISLWVGHLRLADWAGVDECFLCCCFLISPTLLQLGLLSGILLL